MTCLTAWIGKHRNTTIWSACAALVAAAAAIVQRLP